MSFTYAIGDLHGRFDLLEAAYEAILEHSADHGGGNFTFVTLGDYVDRGPQSRQIIEWLVTKKMEESSCTLIVLKGNHEDMMSICCRKISSIGWWIRNGGGTTLMSYGQKDGDIADPTVIPTQHLSWIDKLPLLYVDKHRVYVHAWLNRGRELNDQESEDILWKLYPEYDSGGYRDYHVVHGHHHFEHGPMICDGRTNLDVWAYHTGRLVVAVFDDNKSGAPVEQIEIFSEVNE